MRPVTIAGPPSSGKTSVILRVIEELTAHSLSSCVIKFDCLSAQNEKIYAKMNIPVKTALSGPICPDHFFVSNIEEGLKWGKSTGADVLITESAGLCNRCSPHIREVLAVCVIDNLSGIHTPTKIGPMLKTADMVVITKGDIVSQAEREVFAFRVRRAAPVAEIVSINGITGQGRVALTRKVLSAPLIDVLEGKRLRFTMPGALCSYCLGEKKISRDSQIGYTRKIKFTD